MAWEYSDFVRLSCVATTRHAALSAIESRIEKLRRAGYEIPPDAVVEIRPSGFGFTASLVLPERLRDGRSYRLRRWLDSTPARRLRSDTYPLFPGVVYPDDEEQKSG